MVPSPGMAGNAQLLTTWRPARLAGVPGVAAGVLPQPSHLEHEASANGRSRSIVKYFHMARVRVQMNATFGRLKSCPV